MVAKKDASKGLPHLQYSAPSHATCVSTLRYLLECKRKSSPCPDENAKEDEQDHFRTEVFYKCLTTCYHLYEWPVIKQMESHSTNLYSFLRPVCTHQRLDRLLSFLHNYNFIHPFHPFLPYIRRPHYPYNYLAGLPANFVVIHQLFLTVFKSYVDHGVGRIQESAEEDPSHQPATSSGFSLTSGDNPEPAAGRLSVDQITQRVCTLLRVMDVPLNRFTGHDRLYELYVYLIGLGVHEFAEEILKSVLEDRKLSAGNFSRLNKYDHKSRTKALAKAYASLLEFCALLPKLMVEVTFPLSIPERGLPTSRRSCKSEAGISTVPTQISTTSSFMIPNLPFEDQLQAEVIFIKLESAIMAIGSTTGHCTEIFLWYLYRFSRRFQICSVQMQHFIESLACSTLAEAGGTGEPDEAWPTLQVSRCLANSPYGNLLLYRYLLAISSISVNVAATSARDTLLELINAQPDNARYVIRYIDLQLRNLVNRDHDSKEDCDEILVVYQDLVTRLVTTLGYSQNFQLVFLWRCLAKVVWLIFVNDFDPGSVLTKAVEQWWIKLHFYNTDSSSGGRSSRIEKKLVAYKDVVAAFLL